MVSANLESQTSGQGRFSVWAERNGGRRDHLMTWEGLGLLMAAV